MTDRIDADLASQEDSHLAVLLDFLRIPSISALPDHASDIQAAAEFVATALRQAGVPEVTIAPTEGWPSVIGRWQVSDDLPTVLIYGHFDVQPPDPLDLWESPAFEPALRDGRIYARGSSDMKANLLSIINTVAAFARIDGQPPLNLRFLFEGEEEIGSPNLAALIDAHRDTLAADVVLSVDGGMDGPNTPTLSVALKGLAACQINLTTSTTDLHSGMYGASVPNAARAIAKLVASFHDDAGRVAVAGFYDDVRDLTDEDRAEIAAPANDDAEIQAQAGVSELVGEEGYTPRERMWARPTLDINGLWSGFQGEGTKTVTPARGHVKITCRLVPDQDPAKIIDLIEEHVANHLPAGASAEVVRFAGSAWPASIRRDHPALLAARDVLREEYDGIEPIITRTGGTVPAVALLQRALGIETVTMAFSLAGSGAHAPNEWFRIEDLHRGPRVFARYLRRLSEGGEKTP